MLLLHVKVQYLCKAGMLIINGDFYKKHLVKINKVCKNCNSWIIFILMFFK